MIERERGYWATFLESAFLDCDDLYGHAASSAAIELAENWKDCWKEGYSDGVSSWQEMMATDISLTIGLLQSWRSSLLSGSEESDASSKTTTSILDLCRKFSQEREWKRQVDESAVLGELHSLEDQHSKILDLFKKVYHRIQSEELAGHFPSDTISELEKLFPYNPNKSALAQRSCPSCGSFERFNVSGKAWITVTDEGIDEYAQPEWDDDSPVRCPRCKWRGTWKDLED